MTEPQLQAEPLAVRVVGKALAALPDGGSFTITEAMLRAAPDLAEVQRGVADLMAAYPEYTWTSVEVLAPGGRATTIAWSRPRSIPTR